MANETAAEVEQKADASFGEGFTGTLPAKVETVVETPVVETAKPETPPTPAAKPEKPEYVRVTRQDWDNNKAAIGKIASLESQIAKLTGSMPKAEAIIQQVIEKVQAETPAGLAVEFSDEDFAGLADWPDISAGMRAALMKAFEKAKLRGTGPKTEDTPKTAIQFADQAAFDAAVKATLQKEKDAEAAEARDKEMKALSAAYPEWLKIVGNANALGTVDPVETEWRKWATTNDPTALTTDSPAEVLASLKRYDESLKAPTPPKPDPKAQRRAVIADAVTPRAEGNAPPLNRPQTAEEAFLSV